MLRADLEDRGSVPGAIFMGLAHWSMDIYQNMLPVLGPMVIPLFALSFTQVGLLTTLFVITSSVLQPILGHFSDKGPGRWLLVGGIAWAAIVMGFAGSAPSYPVLLALVTVAGLGSAAFHPQATALSWVYGGRHRGTAMSVFGLGGNLGFAIGPAVTAAILLRTGVVGTYWLTIPGVMMALALFLFVPREHITLQRRASAKAKTGERPKYLGLVFLCLVVTFRAWTNTSLVIFLPLYFMAREISLSNSSLILTALLVSGAFGGLIGGYVSDLTDRKLVTVASMLAAGPLFVAFLLTSGPLSLALAILGNFALMTGFSIAVTWGQEMLPGREATAGGLIFGFAFGVGGIAVLLTGMISDHFGLTTAIYILAVLPILGGVFGLLVPRLPGRRPASDQAGQPESPLAVGDRG